MSIERGDAFTIDQCVLLIEVAADYSQLVKSGVTRVPLDKSEGRVPHRSAFFALGWDSTAESDEMTLPAVVETR